MLASLDVYWLIGGAGSGKSTVCAELARRGLAIYDMDAHIFGAYHGRFDPARHPTNSAWASAESSLAFLLGMSWSEFSAFNESALAEYLDLFADDARQVSGRLVVDGGAWHPGLLTRALSPRRVVCLDAPQNSSRAIWEEDEARAQMKSWMTTLPDPVAAWETFLEFDAAITALVVAESRTAGVTVCSRAPGESVQSLTTRVAAALGLGALV